MFHQYESELKLCDCLALDSRKSLGETHCSIAEQLQQDLEPYDHFLSRDPATTNKNLFPVNTYQNFCSVGDWETLLSAYPNPVNKE